MFRFCVIGAASIAEKFIQAVGSIEDAEVVAVGSRSLERAQAFAEKNQVPRAYGSYQEMLLQEKPDAAYIAVTTDAHYEMCMLCLKHNIPFLCEKTMCTSYGQTKEVFDLAREKGLFAMEAMWSRFLPAIVKAKEWLEQGRIGQVTFGDINVGFMPEKDDNNRFWNRALGGGAAFDLTVYSYEIMTFMLGENYTELYAKSTFAHTGVDSSNVITLSYPKTLAVLKGSIEAHLDEKMVLYGSQGRIELLHPHYAYEAYLYDGAGNVVEHFVDQETPNGNGFYHEICETIRCIQEGLVESPIVPHQLTLNYSEICDVLTNPAEFID